MISKSEYVSWFVIIAFGIGIIVLDLSSSDHKNVKNMEVKSIKAELVLVKGGEFIMGKNYPAEKTRTYKNNPGHKIFINSFLIDKYEVTNFQYFQFCNETGRKPPIFWGVEKFRCSLDFPNHPVVGVSYFDAREYAKWRGLRLPTEAEWEYAARGGLIGKKYPHGDKLDKSLINFGQNLDGTSPVGRYPPNKYGLYDMSGNVREWVNDFYQTYYYLQSPYKNPKGPTSGRFKVIRGGSWLSGPTCVTVIRRNALAPNWVDFAVGFRCAKDIDK
jgi:sulfatase modifying factor 1